MFEVLLNEVFVRVTADNVSTPQCVDLVQLWARVIGSPRFTGDAKDIFNQAGSIYTQIINASDNFPNQGDIVVWSGAFNGGPGHTGIATGRADINTFDCFEQNDPTGTDSHVRTYNYGNVLGWLRPNNPPQNQQQIIDSLRKERDDNWNAYQAEIDKLNNLQKQFDDYKTSHPSVIVTPSVVSDNNTVQPILPTPRAKKSFWQSIHDFLNSEIYYK